MQLWWKALDEPTSSRRLVPGGSHVGPVKTDRAGQMRPAFPFPEVTTGDLNIAIVGQLPPTKFALRDQFEPSAMKMVGFEAAFRRGFLGSRIWNTRRGTRTTPSYSPTATPNSTADRSGFQRPSGENGRTLRPPRRRVHVRVMFSNSARQRQGRGRAVRRDSWATTCTA